MQLQKDLAAQGAGDLASRNAAINRLFTGFGQLPDINQAGQQLGISDLGQAIDPTTGQLAASNPYSTTARLGQSHTDAIRSIRAQLASRGLLQSGELGYRLGRENDAYGQASSDATQRLLDAISQIQGQFTSGQRAAQAQANQGAESATTRQIGLNPATGSQTAHLDPATGLYVDGGGNFWNGDGSPASKPTPPPATPTDNASTTGLASPGSGLNIGAFLAPGVASGRRLDPRFSGV